MNYSMHRWVNHKNHFRKSFLNFILNENFQERENVIEVRKMYQCSFKVTYDTTYSGEHCTCLRENLMLMEEMSPKYLYLKYY